MDTRRGAGRARMMALLAVLSVLVLTGCNDFFAASWGRNASGQLGNGTTTDSSTPVDVNTDTALQGKVITQVSAAAASSCAATAAGTAACWGQLPDLTGTRLVPVPIPNTGVLAGRTVTKAVTGVEECALTSDGTVACWDSSGQNVRPKLGPLAGKQVMQFARVNYGCALTLDGVLACWGGPAAFEEPRVMNATGVLAGKTIVEITARCALTSDNLIACWGANEAGELGNGSSDPFGSSMPVLVVQDGAMAGKTIVGLGDGSSIHACAVAADGSAYCWGFNSDGQLGDGTTGNSNVPVAVKMDGALAGRRIVEIATGFSHTCAILDDESLACWGDNSRGQLGNGTNVDSLVPVVVNSMPGADGKPRPATAVAGGREHTLAIYQDQVASQFVPITPRRVLDTRAGGVGAVGPGGQVTFSVAGEVPAGTTAVSYNITATGQTASGAAALVPDGSTASATQTSVINWGAGQQTIANGFIVKVPETRQLQIKLNSSGSSHFIVDITGYFIGPGNPAGTLYHPADGRVYDSRDGDGPLAPNESRVINVAGPQSAGAASAGAGDAWPVQGLNGSTPTAAAVNVTATGTVGSGVFTVAKGVSTTTSTVNWSGAAQTVANAVITDVAADGSFTVTNNGRTPADVVVDLTGTFEPASIPGGASFFPSDPHRVYDSRGTNGPLAGGTSRGNTVPIPAGAVAVAVNTTITGTSGTGYLSVTPPATAVPTTSMVNWYTSPTTRANGSIVSVHRTGLRAYTGGDFSTQYLYDTAGFFR